MLMHVVQFFTVQVLERLQLFGRQLQANSVFAPRMSFAPVLTPRKTRAAANFEKVRQISRSPQRKEGHI
jgi:hypothetical protein